MICLDEVVAGRCHVASLQWLHKRGTEYRVVLDAVVREIAMGGRELRG